MTPSSHPLHQPVDAIVVPDTNKALDLLRQRLMESSAGHASRARAERTWKAYRSDWKAFEDFCSAIQVPSMPATPATLCMYISHLHDDQPIHKSSSIHRAVSAISQMHVLGRKPNPRTSDEVKEVLKGIRRDPNKKRVRKATALLPVAMRKMLATLPNNLRGVRDRAIVLLGFSTAMRRSEIANLDVEDVAFVREGMLIRLGATKTDQEGKADPIPVLYGSRPDACPVRAMRDWVDARKSKKGPLFVDVTVKGWPRNVPMSDRAVARLLKRLGKAIGLTEEQVEFLSGHSLRSGFVTTSAKLGTPLHKIQKISRHKNTDILLGYIREANQWEDNATRGITDADF